MSSLRHLRYYASLVLSILSVALASTPLASLDELGSRWGPYRPNLYFGVRPQIPRSLLLGLMWADGESLDSTIKTLRDTCEQDDGIEGYGWPMYDTRVGGIQSIHDAPLHVDISTEFLRTPDSEGWAVRVRGAARDSASKSTKIAIVFHVAMEDAPPHQDASANMSSTSLSCQLIEAAGTGGTIDAGCEGVHPQLGSFKLRMLGRDNVVVEQASVASQQVAEHMIWQAKAVLTNQLRSGSSSSAGEGNMHFLRTVVQAPFAIDFVYSSASTLEPLTSTSITSKMDKFRMEFPQRVDAVFPRAKPFQGGKYAEFTQSLLSNLLAGLGFFYGNSKVDTSHASEYDEIDLRFWEKAAAARARATVSITKEKALLTHTPSRPFFPRGFLWDEGFHLLPVIEWDLDLAIAVLHSWFDLMDDDGWIGREQILGPEARSKVPPEFQVQYPHYSNPPTLSLLLPVIISKLTMSSPYHGHSSVYLESLDRGTKLIRELYPLVARHYAWFRRTQAGNFSSIYPRPDSAMVGEGYRWRGRTPKHTLTSGLDDYPRADPPHPGELHVDALTWVAASSRALQAAAEYLGETADAVAYAKQYKDAKHNLDIIHWDPVKRAYCDATITSGGHFQRVCHLGYVSLMPLLLGLIDPEEPHLAEVLDLVSDPKRLWSASGLRSLSMADPHYGDSEDYWRGAIWIHLNVLAVLRLKELGEKSGPHRARAQKLSSQLRQRLVQTVYESWAQTGFLWEQYDDKTGRGKRSRAFTGWSACIILLMGLEDIPGPGVGHRPSSWESLTGVWFSPQTLILLVILMVLLVTLRRRLMGLGRYMIERARRWN